MANKLFLLDGMALIYRAHFALIRSPIFTSRGFNTSALYVFTNTLLEILEKRGATHIAVAFDTAAPTQRHIDFPSYKAHREEMPEEISASIPYIKQLIGAFNIPVLTLDGFEADDIIGTLTRLAEECSPDLETFMVTPDKDFAQLVTERTRIFKPGRQGSDVEILGPEQIRENWQVEPIQVIDVLALWGDASDNVPGVPGVGEKTAKKLIEQFGSVENLLAHSAELKGKQKENVENHKEQALLAKRLVTIDRFVPLERIERCKLLDADSRLDLSCLARTEPDRETLQNLCIQFEFHSLGKRLFGSDFKSGHGNIQPLAKGEVFVEPEPAAKPRTLSDTPHVYAQVTDAAGRAKLIAKLLEQKAFCFDTRTTSAEPKSADITGLAFSWESGTAHCVAIPSRPPEAQKILREFSPVFENPAIEKIGHNLKFDLTALRWHGLIVHGPFFDTLLAHTVIEPEQRHTLDSLSETLLGYSRTSSATAASESQPAETQLSMLEILDETPGELAEHAAEEVDLTWQIAQKLRPRLAEAKQERVFFEIESPLLPVLVDLEHEGIAVDTKALAEYSGVLGAQMDRLCAQIEEDAGQPFNQNSPAQLGEILFGKLKLLEKPKKTKTGQFKTDEQTLRSLLGIHPIIEHILAYRQAAKLKSTYVDALPLAVSRKSGRVHTQFDQLMTATGRLASNNPNLQNIPIRTDMGREIRKAFIPRSEEFLILSADYSQIELRVMASLSGDPSLIEAFEHDLDIHTATAARVYGVPLADVAPAMRSKAKMVNFGIIYGITGFGLAQRLGIPRAEAAGIIEEYFRQYPCVKEYMDSTIRTAREKGYAETLTGRRRYLREINSQNATVRAAAERTAINTPVQGTAADMIKLAMIRVQNALQAGGFRTRMLLQVHDELVFDLHREEEQAIVPLVVQGMKEALPLRVPIVVETGTGRNWLEAH